MMLDGDVGTIALFQLEKQAYSHNKGDLVFGQRALCDSDAFKHVSRTLYSQTLPVSINGQSKEIL